MMVLTSLGMKWLAAWLVLWLVQPLGGFGFTKAALVAAVLAVASWAADRLLPFKLQGVTRWAIDGGLAALTIYVAQFLWAGPNLTLLLALLAGYTIGAIEIPLHFFLVARFGLQDKDDQEDGIR